jgi:hypothetical protein
MLEAIVCKMQCHSKQGTARPESDSNGSVSVETVRFGAVWEGTTEAQQQSENAIFGKWTPNGEMMLGLVNPNAANFFQKGKKYYLTITEAPD